MTNTSGTRHYTGFGCLFSSNHPIMTLTAGVPATTTESIQLCFGDCPHPTPPQWDKDGGFYRFTGDTFHYQAPDLASYHIRGNSIWIEAGTDRLLSQQLLIEAHLFGSVLAAVMQRSRRLTLHANAVLAHGLPMLICGWPSTGKSTFACGLYQRGAQHFSDDLCVLAQTIHGIVCEPGLLHIKLMPDSLEHYRIPLESSWKLSDELGKRVLPVMPCRELLDNEALPVAHVVLLERGSSGEPRLSELSGAQKFLKLRNHLFRAQFLPDSAKAHAVSMLMSLASQAHVWQLSLPPAMSHIDKAITQVLAATSPQC